MSRTCSFILSIACALSWIASAQAQETAPPANEETAPAIPAEVSDVFKSQVGRFVGTWTVEETKGEQVVKGELTAEWSKGGESVIWNYVQTEPSPETKVTGSGMFGWDGRRKKVVEVSFWSSGEAVVGVHDRGDDTWNCQTRITVQTGEGLKNGQTHRRFTWKSPDELEIVATKVFVDHRPKPEYTTILKRKNASSQEASQ